MWKAFKSYIWWSHPRGSLQYDVMVSLILAFIFISPHYIDYRDKPHPTKAGTNLASYLVPANDPSLAGAPVDLAALKKALPPDAGSVHIDRFEALKDTSGNIAAYRVWVRR